MPMRTARRKYIIVITMAGKVIGSRLSQFSVMHLLYFPFSLKRKREDFLLSSFFLF